MWFHWSPQKIRKAAQKHNSSNRIHLQFRKTFIYESLAIRSNPGAFPCTDLSLILLVFSPAPFQHRWEQQHHRYQWQNCNWQIKMVDMGWTQCLLIQMCTLNILPADSTLLQPVPAPHTTETLEQLLLYLHEQTALQGSKTLRRDRHSQLGLQLLCNVLVKISTGICLYQHPAKLLQSGNSCTSKNTTG